MHEYLNWWQGGIALGVLTILFRVLTGRALGVSGSWRKVVFWRRERENDKAAAAVNQDQDGAADALLAATMAEFGEGAVDELEAEPAPEASKAPARQQAVPWTAHLVFLISLVVGGFLWAVYNGDFHISYVLSAVHSHISSGFGDMTFMMLVGGFLVGMGTQMAGGCSSGHGLSGCANLSWSSLLATAVFFSTAVVVANAIKMVMQ